MRTKLLRLVLGVAALGAVGYLAFCFFAAQNKEALLYPSPAKARAEGRRPPKGAESWWLTMADGEKVEAWWHPAPGASSEHPAPALLYFHGNAELIDDQRQLARLWQALGVSVLLCEHAGYGRSGGVSSVEQDIANAVAWHDRLSLRPDVRAGSILTHGFSFGGALAAQVAARRPVAGVILESTFSSLPSMARRMGVWIYLGGEALDTAKILRELDPAVPVLIAHGTSDAVIPVAEGRRLAAARPTASFEESSYPHTPWAQDEPGHRMLRALLARALAKNGEKPSPARGEAPDITLASPAPDSAP
jgi:alpha-beta hydrolase superfamily lysophospholipase